MKNINFRNLFGVLAVTAATAAAFMGVITLSFPSRHERPPIILLEITALAVFSLAGFCSSLVYERYRGLSRFGMVAAALAFFGAITLFTYFQLTSGWHYSPRRVAFEQLMSKGVFFFSSIAFVTGYISLLLTTLRGYSCVLNRFIWGTISLLCVLWVFSQGVMFTDGRMMQEMYPLIGSVYFLSLMGGVWIFVLSRMGVAEPKKFQDEMFTESV